MASTTAVELDWSAPGPGTWNLDKVHVPRPATAHFGGLLPAFEAGFADSAARYGWLVERFNLRLVNGFMYSNISLVDGPEFPVRFERSTASFATKRWRPEVEHWDGVAKPAGLTAHRALLAIDPSELAAADLAEYLARCGRHHYDMWLQHHTYNGTQMIPTGDFVVSTRAWTGLPTAALAALLRGASPISRGWCPETEALVNALRGAPGALDLVASDGDARRVLDGLRALGDDVASALDEWLLITGNRPVDGFDVADPTGNELPAFLVRCIRNALDTPSQTVSEQEIERVRSLVPAEHRDDFDDRLEEARHVYRVRDERGIYSDALACGIMRRAMLAAGDRLAKDRRLPSAALAVEATVDELAALLEAADDALIGVLQARAAHRATLTIADAPDFLGDPPSGPPSFDGLPPDVVRMMSALVGVNDNSVHGGDTSTDESGQRVLQGIPASAGQHRGVARVVNSPEDFDRLEDGDVLVTITTGEAFNVAIAMVSALVTDQGNVMSHAGITAREYGIPAVVGASVATAVIPDGAVVEVDGTAGTIRWT